MEKTLESFLEVISLLKDILQEDMAICVTNTTEILYVRAGDAIDLKNTVGKKLSIDDPLYKAMKEGKVSVSIAPKGVYDVPFKEIVYPIKDLSGEVIGGIGLDYHFLFATREKQKNGLLNSWNYQKWLISQ